MKKAFAENYINPVVERFSELDTPNGGFYTSIPQAVQYCWFLDDKELSVLLALSTYADENGRCKVYQRTLARKVKIKSTTTLRTKLKSLVKKRFILQVNTDGESSIYQIKDYSTNPYILLSEAIEKVEQVAKKKYGVSVSKIAETMDELIASKIDYMAMITKIEESFNGYDVALKSVQGYVNEALGLEMDISLQTKNLDGNEVLR
ncbi:hypothetical protein BCM0079_p315 (plasmid) [Bacillus cereus]|uniref:helix-turn-helix domain-containing protein n=1 Tax=Bacillus cereus TaxID=1396 RepID=UPI001F269283|nr:helix-turn-helix domain-containing protein [Bacillus cereus]BCC27273.1 hypothetical protein BCM0079_p315 [Bacillus cereus]